MSKACPCCSCTPPFHSATCTPEANRLRAERAEAEVERLRAEAEAVLPKLERARELALAEAAEVERLKAEIDGRDEVMLRAGHCGALRRRAEKAEAEVERLRAALREIEQAAALDACVCDACRIARRALEGK